MVREELFDVITQEFAVSEKRSTQRSESPTAMRQIGKKMENITISVSFITTDKILIVCQ
jgi:hypothetical protein